MPNLQVDFSSCAIYPFPNKLLAGQLLLGFHLTLTNILENKQADCMGKKLKEISQGKCFLVFGSQVYLY